MPGQDLIDAIEAARLRPGLVQLEEVFRIALLYSADDRACRDVLDRLTTKHRADVAEAWAQHHLERKSGRALVVGAHWHAAPFHEGWYVVYGRGGQAADLGLIRFEGGEYFDENETPRGNPASLEFEGAKWLGPVEKP